MTAPQRPHPVDGQRLEAADLCAERGYHVAARWALNRTLFGPGRATGMEVTAVAGDPRRVAVSPGVALDGYGREILLAQPREIAVPVPDQPVPGGVAVSHLVVAAAWEPTAAGATPDVALAWSAHPPPPGGPAVALALVELADDGTVTAVRRPGAGVGGAVVPLSLCGEADLDAAEPVELRFRVRPGRLTSAVLHLRALEFSALYYTELGGHTHTLTVPFSTKQKNLQHSHDIADGETGTPRTRPTHRHLLNVQLGSRAPGIDEEPSNPGWTSKRDVIRKEGRHSHALAVDKTDEALPGDWTHKHTVTGATLQDAGSPDAPAAGARLRFVADLRLALDGRELTGAITGRLQARDGTGRWATLGDGTGGHDLAAFGTGALDLLALGADLAPGEHHLHLSVPTGGGRVRYALYVE